MEDENKRLTFSQFMASLWWVVKSYWEISPLLTLGSFISSAITEFRGLVYTYIAARTIDGLLSVQAGNATFIQVMTWPIAGMAVYSLLFSAASYLNNYCLQHLWMVTRPSMLLKLYKKLESLGVAVLEKPDVNNQIERVVDNLYQMNRQFEIMSSLAGTIVGIVGSILIVANFEPLLVPLLLLVALPGVILDQHFLRELYVFDRRVTEERRRAYQSIYNLTNSVNLQELSITQSSGYLVKKFRGFIEYWIGRQRQIRLSWYGLGYLANLPDTLARLLGFVVVFQRFFKGTITIGQVTFYMQAINTLSSDISRLTIRANNLFESSQRIREIQQMFTLVPVYGDGKVKLGPLKMGPEIILDKVSFVYPNTKKLVLNNIDLKINSGEKIAIVGHNGAGKTTLVKLMARFYQTTGGKILINNKNINTLNINSLYRNMGVLFQEYNTYGQLTAKENIAIGDLKKNTKSVVKAAKQADAHNFIGDFDRKYDQILSEKYKGGIRPSTGQWQKIAIARFFYRDAPLVIFDEPTAAIDAISEKKIFDRIYKFFTNKTVVIISHRFSTVRNADRIIVLEKGKVAEEGTHTELIKLNGKYAKAFKLQAEGYAG